MGRKRKRLHSGSHNIQNVRDISESLRQTVDALFEKKFRFEGLAEWIVPDINNEIKQDPWQIEELTEMKQDLNRTKDKLSEEEIGQWHKHTQFTNKAGSVIHHVLNTVRPELCTQAWCKFHEILWSYDIAPKNPECLNSVHLCEAPGAFITSLNHYLKTVEYQGKWSWLGNSLNPYFEGTSMSTMINDDRLIHNTLDNWYFGPSNVGDIRDEKLYRGLCEKTEEMGTIHLVTADGSVDCQNNPAEQESIVSPIHYCEAITALTILSQGGNFVIKVFTLFEYSSVCLMYLLNCVFHEVHVIKPATSKPGNSEVYVVCLHYKGRDVIEAYLPVLVKYFYKANEGQILFPLDKIPQTYVDQHITCCKLFKGYQERTILENIELFHNMTPEMRLNINMMHEYCNRCFVKRCSLKWVSDDTVVKGTNAKLRSYGKINKRHWGSFNERQKTKQLPWKQRVQLWQPWDAEEFVEWLQNSPGPLSADSLTLWTPQTGLMAEKIHSSRFCESVILDDYNDKLDNCQFFNNPSYSTDSDVKVITEESVSNIWQEIGVDFGNVKLCDATVPFDQNPGHEELRSKRKLVETILLSLNGLALGGNISIVLYDSLTRFTVNVIYILYRSFSQITFRPLQMQTQTKNVLACNEYHGCHDNIVSYLERIYQLLDSEDVQQLIPLAEIYGSTEFHNYITPANDYILQVKIDSFMEKEKQYIENEDI